MYTIRDRPVVDFIGKYEALMADMGSACGHLVLPFSPELFPHAKASTARNFSNPRWYRDWYGPDEKLLVRRIYRNKIDFFGYEF